jgi:hypothetical protein
MKSLKRRGFIKNSMVVSAGMAIGAPAYIKGFQQTKPSDIINVAVAGIHDRGGFYGGSGHAANYTMIKNSRVAAICDVDETLFPKAIALLLTTGTPYRLSGPARQGRMYMLKNQCLIISWKAEKW